MKPRPRATATSHTLSADFGEQLHAIKQDISSMMSLLQAKWEEIRRETPGETVTELVKRSGLDQTWNGLKEAAVSTVQPWLPSPAPKQKRARKRAVRSVKRTAKKAAKKAVRAVSKSPAAVKRSARTVRKSVKRAVAARKRA